MLDTVEYRADFHSTIPDVKPDGAAEVTPNRFADQRNTAGTECLPRGNQVAFSHLHGARRSEAGKHAGAPGQARGDAILPGSCGCHELEQVRHGRLRELRGISVKAGQSRRRQEYVRHPTHLGFCVVQQDRYAAAQPNRDQDIIGRSGPKLGHPDQELAATHAARR
jgi:hypothetical protein